MFYGAKNGVLLHERTQTYYGAFGRGDKTLIMIPGLSEGIETVKDCAIPFSMLYRLLAKHFRIYVFGRKNDLPQNYTTRDMAKDLLRAMDLVGIQKAHILGISQGGMIAQYLALDAPYRVDKLVLAVTTARPGQMTRDLLQRWMEMAQQGLCAQLLMDEAEHAYSQRYLKYHRFLYPFLSLTEKPENLPRFRIQANACMTHDTLNQLEQISCPTLVIGGEHDRIMGPEAAGILADGIPNSRLIVYPGLGHSAFEESKDFLPDVLTFLQTS